MRHAQPPVHLHHGQRGVVGRARVPECIDLHITPPLRNRDGISTELHTQLHLTIEGKIEHTWNEIE